MRGLMFSALAGLLTAAPLSLAQPPLYDAPPYAPRMSRQEAAEIANYWVRSYLRRRASADEVRYWADRLVNEGSPAGTLAAFLASREYYDQAGGNPAGFVYNLIRDVGHHEPGRGEVRDWVERTRPLDRRDIAYRFLRDNPANWWPGPQATPPPELQRFRDDYRDDRLYSPRYPR